MNTPPKPILRWQGKFLRVLQCGRWEYADRVGASGAVVIVAVTQDGKLVLTEQYRIPVGQRVIELPAGLAGDAPGNAAEALAEAARRELLEETGFAAAEMECLFCGPPSPGLASELVAFFRATGLRRVSAGGGVGHEEIAVHEVPLAAVEQWLQAKAANGVLVDTKVYAGLYFAAGRGAG
jgi:ADP-ribose pyrophosphatase